MQSRVLNALTRNAFNLLGYCAYLFSAEALTETYSTLPPPPSVRPGQPGQPYVIELVVNQAAQGRLVPMTLRDGHYLIASGDLIQAGLPAAQLNADITDVSAMPGVTADYNRARQRLSLSVPADWLPGQSLNLERKRSRHPGRVSHGALYNYDFYGNRANGGAVHTALWNELRVFGKGGHFSCDGVVQQQTATAISGRKSVVRYNTYWANQNEDDALRWVIGDAVTDALSWSSSVRFGGVLLSRDFSLRPDIVTYPLPSFAGQAAVPTTVDVFVDGYRTSSHSLQPGPYSLNNMPFINGAGEAVLLTSDAVGKQVVTTLPFYVSSNLLKSGLADFSLSAGALRRGYGTRNAEYGTPMVNGSYRQGVTDWLTFEGHGEGAQNLFLGGAGSLLKLWRAGVVNGTWTRSQLGAKAGEQISWGYQYNNRFASIGMQRIKRSPRFANLALYDNDALHLPNVAWTLSRDSAQYNAGLAFEHYGSLGMSLIDIHSQGGDRTRLWNFSWSKSLWNDASLFVAASYDQQQRGYAGAISLIMPFGSRTSAGLSVERGALGGLAERLTVSRATASDGGFGWDASYARQQTEKDYHQATLDWRSRYADTSAGFYGLSGSTIQWADVSGALLLMDGRVMPANQINNAFVLVKTGVPDVIVRYENQPAGVTDRFGYLLIPNVNANYPAKYDIDILNIPADLTAPVVEQRFAVPRQSGYLLHFPIEPLRAASVNMVDEKGQPLPVGTRVSRPGKPENFVGWEGIAWLEDLETENGINAVTPDGRACQTHLTLPQGKPRALHTYGPLSCPLSPLS